MIQKTLGCSDALGNPQHETVAFSHNELGKKPGSGSPPVLRKALGSAVSRNFIERVEEGYFDPNGGAISRKAHYFVKWTSSVASLSDHSLTTPKSVAGDFTPKIHSKKRSGTTPRTVAHCHSVECSGIQITDINNILNNNPPLL